MKSHETVVNPAPSDPLSTYQPLSFGDRMHLTAICILAAAMVALIFWGILEGKP